MGVSYIYILSSSKPVFGFGWIETRVGGGKGEGVLPLLNPSSASAGLRYRSPLVELGNGASFGFDVLFQKDGCSHV